MTKTTALSYERNSTKVMLCKCFSYLTFWKNHFEIWIVVVVCVVGIVVVVGAADADLGDVQGLGHL